MNVRDLSRWRKKEVEEVLKRSYRLYRSPALDIRIATQQCTTHGRVLAITPKYIGSAPVRNTFRRRVKALFYEEKLYIQPYCWIIFAKKEAAHLSYEQLKSIFFHAQTLISTRTYHTAAQTRKTR